MTSSYTVQTCGKLYLSGEYAILYPNQLALIKPIPIYMTAVIKEHEVFRISSDLFTHSVGRERDEDYALIQDTIAIFEQYLGRSLSPFSLSITGKLEQHGKKYGIGSSGSVVVLTLKALAAFHHHCLTPERLFKLACVVLLSRGDNGSMGDLACIAYETLIVYQSFDRERIRKNLRQNTLGEVLDDDWGYRIEPIRPQLAVTFMVGWTQEPAISKDLVKQVKGAINDVFLTQSNHLSHQLRQTLESGTQADLIALVKKQVELLCQLHPAIMTNQLKQLMALANHYGGVAKTSGAGGGDCGIAFVFDDHQAQSLREAWAQEGIICLYHDDWGTSDES